MQRVVAVPIGLALLLASPPLAAQVVGEKKEKTIVISWAEHATKHYVIAYEEVIPEPTVKRIGGELEDILAQYVSRFRVAPSEKLKVKFLDSLNTYEQEGGNPSHPGYYNPGSGYLVLRQMDFIELIPTAYHEAFHQYLHMYVGDGVEIPIWFNEGMAMYYEGMQRLPGAGKRPLNPKDIKFTKLRMIQDAIGARSAIPLAELIRADYKTFHDKDREDLHYNQSFSVIYFLMERAGGSPIAFAKALRETKDLDTANEKLFGKEMKNLKAVETAWRDFTLAKEIPRDKRKR